MRPFASALLKQLSFYKKDENVLFFLLMNHEKLDVLFGKQGTAKAFRNTIEFEEAKRWISKQYEKRGFSHLIPHIHTTIDEWGRCL